MSGPPTRVSGPASYWLARLPAQRDINDDKDSEIDVKNDIDDKGEVKKKNDYERPARGGRHLQMIDRHCPTEVKASESDGATTAAVVLAPHTRAARGQLQLAIQQPLLCLLPHPAGRSGVGWRAGAAALTYLHCKMPKCTNANLTKCTRQIS